jgi:signal transduction histidine kinase/CheY-like chemotaxis protein/HPt (histidine-containing phosphotransfer) domain-containing protein
MEQTILNDNEAPSSMLAVRLQQPLDRLLQSIVQQTTSAAACIALYDEPAGGFAQVFHHGDVEPSLLTILCGENGPARSVMLGKQLMLLSVRDEDTSDAGAALEDQGLRCALLLPLCDRSRHYGVLIVLNAVQEIYAKHQRKLLFSLAGLITAALAAELDLVQQQHMAAVEAGSRPNFLVSMSNEIRASLNGMLGMLSLLKQTRLTLEQQEYVDMSQSSGNDLLGMLTDILDISRIDAGKLELDRIEFDLRHSVEDLIETFTGRAQQKQLELASIIFASVPQMVRGDPARLRQVLAKLLGNALKYTDTGEVVVTVFPVEEDETGMLIGFEIRDTGIGISVDDRLPIFNATENDNAASQQSGNARLGLVISKELAEYMGGEIGVESEPGKGSTFWFTARFGRCETRSEQAAAPVDLSSVRTLVVDRNPTSCAVLEQMFLAWGMHYESVPDGATALEMLRRTSHTARGYDLVIMEMTLPDMNGIELGRRIDAEIEPASCRKIMLTSHGQRGDAQSARRAGLQAYITRPIRGAQLRDVIERVMGLKQTDSNQLITRHSLNESGAGWQYRILIAEDNVIDQKIALVLLKKLGLHADVAGNGVDAVSAVRAHRYDIVLMDIQMPEMNGYEATAAIRELEQATSSGQHIPIIALTGSEQQGDQERCIEAGMDDYIAKPVIYEQLKYVLAQWLPAESSALVLPDVPVDGQQHPALDADPIDAPIFENLRLSLASEFENVVGVYLDDAHKRLADMQIAAASGDGRSLNRAAHTLKSASRYLGILPLADLCSTLEIAADHGDLETAGPMVPLIGLAFERAEKALRLSVEASLPAANP